MADPHKEAIAKLSAQIDHYLATGGRVLAVDQGVSAEAPVLGTTTHSEKLKARRDRRLPQIKAMLDEGHDAKAIGKKLGVDPRSIAITMKENNLQSTEPA